MSLKSKTVDKKVETKPNFEPFPQIGWALRFGKKGAEKGTKIIPSKPDGTPDYEADAYLIWDSSYEALKNHVVTQDGFPLKKVAIYLVKYRPQAKPEE